MSLQPQLWRLTPPTLKSGWCPSTYQELANTIIGGTQINYLIQTGTMFINYGPNTPIPENRIYPWINTTDGRTYTFQQGMWTAPNPRDADGEWIIWPGTENELWSYDGGDGTDPSSFTPTDTAGAMWEVVASMAGRMPIGVGAVPSDGTSPRTLSIGNTGGEGRHSLAEDEMPPHTHDFTVIAQNSGGSNSGALTGGENNNPNDGQFDGTTESTGGDTQTPPVVVPHENLPPYYTVYFAKRTARKYYVLAP